MNFLSRTFFRSQFARNFAFRGGAEKVVEKAHPKAKKIKELQRKFTVDDGVPVYLKGGAKDKLFFQITVAAVGIGLLMGLNVFYCLIVPGANPPPPVIIHEEEQDEEE